MADTAWGTPGWTAQNLIPITSDLPPALIPPDIKMTKVVAQFGSVDGKHQTGFVVFEASADLTHVPSGGVNRKPSWLGRVYDGALSISLPATDNTALNPSGWKYKVTVIIYGQVVESFYALIPYSATDLPFTSLVQIPLLP